METNTVEPTVKPPPEEPQEPLPADPAGVSDQNTRHQGWFRAMRGSEPLELIKRNPNALILAFVIAHRARYHDGFNQHGLERGEALLGDFRNYGMSQRKYRTAKMMLEQFHFATFRTTSRGTIGKLTDERLFAIWRLQSDNRSDKQATHRRQGDDKQTTTNKDQGRSKEQEDPKITSTINSWI